MPASQKHRYCFYCLFKNGDQLPFIVYAKDEATATGIVASQSALFYGEAPLQIHHTPMRRMRHRPASSLQL